ncbi:protease (Partial), partial [Seminavis robusta]
MATPTEQPTEEGIEATPRAFLAQSLVFRDSPEDMTYGRRVALWLNERFPGFYGPESGPNAPSLAKAWAFFEHVTLERYIVQDDNDDNDNDITDEAARSSGKRQSTDRKMSIAEPGEHHYRTKLYPLLTTPLSQLGDFGLGFGLYFSTLRDFAILALLGGLLSLPNLLYFASTDYDSTTNENLGSGLLRGSAICLDRKWVPCPTCQKDEFEKQNKGAYPIKRFSLAWVTVPSDAGYYLNVTDYLDWKLLDTNHSIEDINSESEWLTWDLVFNRTEEQNVVRLDNLRNATIPTTDAYGSIILNEQDGFILNGTNVTEQLGYTPLWCGYSTPSDCYLDLYPSITEKHEDGFVDDPSQTRVGDSDFVEVGFALKNLCDGATAQQGWINWGTLLIMILGTTHIYFRTERMEVRFDEDEQTAQDYSIIVKNPPPDAWDPEEWKAFFEQALDNDPDHPNNSGSPRNKVTVCTVDVDNEAIIGYLVRRRDLRRQIEMALPPDTPLDIETLKKEVERIQEEKTGMCSSKSPVPLMVKKLEELETEIRTFFKTVQEPDTTQVYLTFETESAQRRVLKQMSIGTLDARRNKTEGIDPLYLFRGKHALEVREPDEPSTIRWQELNATESTVLIRKIATSLATVG